MNFISASPRSSCPDWRVHRCVGAGGCVLDIVAAWCRISLNGILDGRATNERKSMGIDLDAYREQSLETWGQMAPGWEDRRQWMMGITGPVSDWLVEKADPQPGG